MAHLWQHCETGRTRIVMPDMIVDADASWQVVGPLYLGAAPPTAQAGGWVSVEERLPDLMVDVLAGYWYQDTWMKGKPLVFSYGICRMYEMPDDPCFPQGKRWQTHGCAHSQITHWMPLPAPPTSAEGVEHADQAAPAGTAGLDWDAYSGAQMLAFGRDCSDAAIAAPRTQQPAPAAGAVAGPSEPTGRTDTEIVEQTEELAAFLLSWAFNHEPGANAPAMRDSAHPFAQRAWSAACHIQDMLTQTDVQNALAEMEDAPEPALAATPPTSAEGVEHG